MSDLTEQWKKGELPEGVYYCNTGNTVETLFTWGKNYHQLTNNKDEVYIPEMDDCEIIAPVPSYDEWQLMQDDNKRLKHDVGNLGYKIKNQRHEIDNRLKEIEKLKELLKECELWFTGIVGNMNDKNVGEHNKSVPIGNFEHIFKEFSQKINEALK